MIVFDLRCDPAGHVFEAWFGSSADYESQRVRGLVDCPLCGSATVEKAVMAPRIGGSADTVDAKALMAALATAQREMLAKSEYVGPRFSDEARAIHLGDAEARSIHGQATRAEAESLRAEGIGVAPLPFPVPPPGSEN
ncbi:DUF1178 family protein [Allosphingosinicella indica]|uniref:DUF1178 family protein n=1 Tax=Allosphingosinicella indica TaxID=941907 RepID=A0A1X7GQY3_9SPHN|nr:DUF1178 family protein [Allosphingosinicella indica]SMF73378.1 hypothetical protein SAMN06295910_2135 [Allosphingosinicella indica]